MLSYNLLFSQKQTSYYKIVNKMELQKEYKKNEDTANVWFELLGFGLSVIVLCSRDMLIRIQITQYNNQDLYIPALTCLVNVLIIFLLLWQNNLTKAIYKINHLIGLWFQRVRV